MNIACSSMSNAQCNDLHHSFPNCNLKVLLFFGVGVFKCCRRLWIRLVLGLEEVCAIIVVEMV